MVATRDIEALYEAAEKFAQFNYQNAETLQYHNGDGWVVMEE